MEIEFDPKKNEKNLRERGLSLALGLPILENLVAEFEDARHDYGERRMIAFGMVQDRLHMCVFTERGGVRRIISVRKANAKEQQKWQP